MRMFCRHSLSCVQSSSSLSQPLSDSGTSPPQLEKNASATVVWTGVASVPPVVSIDVPMPRESPGPYQTQLCVRFSGVSGVPSASAVRR